MGAEASKGGIFAEISGGSTCLSVKLLRTSKAFPGAIEGVTAIFIAGDMPGTFTDAAGLLLKHLVAKESAFHKRQAPEVSTPFKCRQIRMANGINVTRDETYSRQRRTERIMDTARFVFEKAEGDRMYVQVRVQSKTPITNVFVFGEPIELPIDEVVYYVREILRGAQFGEVFESKCGAIELDDKMPTPTCSTKNVGYLPRDVFMIHRHESPITDFFVIVRTPDARQLPGGQPFKIAKIAVKRRHHGVRAVAYELTISMQTLFVEDSGAYVQTEAIECRGFVAGLTLLQLADALSLGSEFICDELEITKSRGTVHGRTFRGDTRVVLKLIKPCRANARLYVKCRLYYKPTDETVWRKIGSADIPISTTARLADELISDVGLRFPLIAYGQERTECIRKRQRETVMALIAAEESSTKMGGKAKPDPEPEPKVKAQAQAQAKAKAKVVEREVEKDEGSERVGVVCLRSGKRVRTGLASTETATVDAAPPTPTSTSTPASPVASGAPATEWAV